MKQTYLLLIVFLSFNFQSFAQEEIGLNRPSIKWRQISTETGRIIYPEGLDSAAFRVAGIMRFQQQNDAAIVGTGKTRKVPVILQNQSSLPAGFSTPAPWRNEYYLTPPQNLFTGPVPWLDYVTIHEYRHSQQFHMANQGFTLPYKILMGETGWLLSSLINQPLWFREGDAVTAETELTKAGRGKVPRFHMETRAMRLAGLHYNYEKAHYPASFKNFVPNPYRLGYYMTNKLRREKGDTIWQKVLNDTFRKHFFYAFNQSLKRNTGLSTKALYSQTMAELDSVWKQTDEKVTLTKATVRSNPATKVYTNYRFPHYLPDGSIITLKDGFDEIRTFYKISADGKEEEKLFPHGIYTEDHIMFSASGNLMAWAESEFNERWRNEDYSIIKTYNFETRQLKKITYRTRFFAPSPSPDGTKIVAVENDKFNQSRLVILDVGSGTVLARKVLPFPGHATLAQPRWRSDNQNVLLIVVTEKGNSLIDFDTKTDTATQLTGFTTVPLSRPFIHGDFVYFSAGYSGIDNIYAVHIKTRQLYQVTSVRFGAYEPAISDDGQKLLYTSYTPNGYQLEELELNPADWTPVDAINSTSDFQYPASKFRLSETTDLTDESFTAKYKVEKYNAFTDGLFNFYGWFPVIGNNQYGLELSTRNLMSTLRGTVGVFYNTNENSFGSTLNLTYAALYPVFDLTYGITNRRSAEIKDIKSDATVKQEWRENFASVGVRFPFNLTQGVYRTSLEPGAGYAIYNIKSVPNDSLELFSGNDNFNAWFANLRFSRLMPQARQHVKPRWGQTGTIEYRKAINTLPERLLLTSQLFFPGVLKTHSFNFSAAWKQEEIENTYRFPDVFTMPRGYKPEPFGRMLVLSGNYELPVWYPDISAGGLAFFQRLRTNFFYDYSNMQQTNADNLYLNAAGTELFIDLRVLRLFSMTMGFRYSFVSEKNLVETAPFQFIVTRFEFAN